MGQHASGLDWQWFFQRQKDAGNGKKLKEMNKMNKKWKEMKKRKRNEKREKKWKKWTKNENKWKQRRKKNNACVSRFCLFFLFLALGFRDSGIMITCMWSLIEKLFSFLLFFDQKMQNNRNKWEKHVFLKKKNKGNRKRAARVFLVQCVVEKSEIVCTWPALSKQITVLKGPQPEQIK